MGDKLHRLGNQPGKKSENIKSAAQGRTEKEFIKGTAR
jgi:hypothetical protein